MPISLMSNLCEIHEEHVQDDKVLFSLKYFLIITNTFSKFKHIWCIQIFYLHFTSHFVYWILLLCMLLPTETCIIAKIRLYQHQKDKLWYVRGWVHALCTLDSVQCSSTLVRAGKQLPKTWFVQNEGERLFYIIPALRCVWKGYVFLKFI